MSNDEDSLFRGEYGNWLPIENEDEQLQAILWLEKWANHYAYLFHHSLDEDDKRLFEYVVKDKVFILKESFSLEKPKSFAIRFKLYKEYLHEKPR